MARLEAEIAAIKEGSMALQATSQPSPPGIVYIADSSKANNNVTDAIEQADAPVPLPARLSKPGVPVQPHNHMPLTFKPNYDHQVHGFEEVGLKPEMYAALREDGYACCIHDRRHPTY